MGLVGIWMIRLSVVPGDPFHIRPRSEKWLCGEDREHSRTRGRRNWTFIILEADMNLDREILLRLKMLEQTAARLV